MNVSTTLFRFFSIETFKNSVKILFLLVSLAILLAFHVVAQPRPQGLPRGGARAEEDPGKINTAEKRLRMRQPYL